MNLTDNQRRHLTVLLAHVEDAVLSVERLAVDPPGGNALRHDRRDLPDGFGAASRDDLERVRAGLRAVAQRFGLKPLERSRTQEAMGLLATAIAQLADAGSRGLRGYGDVDPQLSLVLDPELRRLRALLAGVAGRLEANE